MLPQSKMVNATVRGLAALAAVVAASIVLPATTHAADEKKGTDKGWQAVAPGRVEPRSGTIAITSVVVGRVSQVLVGANDKVFGGEPLIKLDDSELRARLAAAEAQVALRQRARNSQSASGKAAERRRAEDALSEAETEVFEARAAVDAAAAARRARRGTDADINVARAALSRAQESLRARAATLRSLAEDGPLPSQPDSQLKIARAEMAAARAAFDNTIIRAPIAGTVLQVNIKAGETAAPSSQLVLIGDVSALRVRAELDERDLSGIAMGQPVIVRAAAFPGREFSGKIAFIAPTVEPPRISARGSRTMTDVDVVEVLIDLSDSGPLAPGMKVDAYFRRDEPPRR